MKNKQTWSFIKDVLLIYLAASKILSWIHSITEMTQGGLGGEVGIGWLILARILNLDLPNILVAICFVYVDRKQSHPLAKFAILYIVALSLMLAYNWTLTWLFGGYLPPGTFLAITIGFSINFFIVTSFLLLKRHFKEKFKEPPKVTDACPCGLRGNLH